MKRSLLAALPAAAVAALPVLAWAQNGAQPTAPMRQAPIMGQRQMMQGSPEQRCENRLAQAAGRLAFLEAKLSLTSEQRPLWDKLQNAEQVTAQKQRQLCAQLKPPGTQTLLERIDLRRQMLAAELEGVKAEQAQLQALYKKLTPEQRAILDHPFHRP